MGTYFVTKNTIEGYKFYSSRFIRYKNIFMEEHENNIWKDGWETNKCLKLILRSYPLNGF